MDAVFVEIMQNKYVYDSFVTRKNFVIKCRKKALDLDGCGDAARKVSKQRAKLSADGILVHYFVRELKIAPTYRCTFMDQFRANTNGNVHVLRILLIAPNKEILDYSWNYRMTHLVRERCELEHTLSWLSTLGGAFSALGDYFGNCAEVAGKISLNQMQLAFRLQDPNVVSRCRLYLGLSLIQQRRFKLAKRIVYGEYTRATNSIVVDVRLVNMCKGIWCKLKYEYGIYRTMKNKA